MTLYINKTILFFLLLAICCLFFLAFTPFVFSQNNNESQIALTQEEQERRRNLEAQIQELDSEIEKYENEIQDYKEQGDSHKRQISTINSQISHIERDIVNNELTLDKTNEQIEYNKEAISELQSQQARQRNFLSDLLLDYYKQRDSDEFGMIISSETVSDFFVKVYRKTSLKESLIGITEELEILEQEIHAEQEDLDVQAEQQLNILEVQKINQESLNVKKNEQQVLLNSTEEQTNRLEGEVEELKKTKQEIRSQIYVFEGTGVATSFGQAYDYAKFASDVTGVRPALILAVLHTESRWGKWIGSCYLTDPSTGAGINFKNGTTSSRVMKASRDVQPFMSIMESLGRDWRTQQVSCPHPNYGYGGAMGPAQFIPSTWSVYSGKASQVLGRPADPFQIRDAFFVSSLLLADKGANQGREWEATMRYYSGDNWQNPAYSPYGRAVMAKAKEYQADIDVLESQS